MPDMGNIPVTTTTKIFPKVLRCKWEAFSDTNGRRTAIHMGGVLTVFPFTQSAGAPEVLRCKLEADCNTNGRCIAILFREVVVAGVSDLLLMIQSKGQIQADYPRPSGKEDDLRRIPLRTKKIHY